MSQVTATLAPRPDRRPVDRGDDGQVEAQHLVDETLGVAQRLPAVLGVVVVADEAGHVAAGAEGGAGTGEHDRPGVAVA